MLNMTRVLSVCFKPELDGTEEVYIVTARKQNDVPPGWERLFGINAAIYTAQLGRHLLKPTKTMLEELVQAMLVQDGYEQNKNDKSVIFDTYCVEGATSSKDYFCIGYLEAEQFASAHAETGEHQRHGQYLCNAWYNATTSSGTGAALSSALFNTTAKKKKAAALFVKTVTNNII